MGATVVLGRCLARTGRGALVALVVASTLGGATALTAWEAADRSESAYADYLRRAQVADVVVNPVIASERVEEILADLPGVRSVASDSLLGVEPGIEGQPIGSETESWFFNLRVSQDGRYRDQDRPIVHEGRLVRDGREAFVSVETAEAFDLQVGDELPLTFLVEEGADPDAFDTYREVGTARAEVVGIGSFADEVLPDELYPRLRVLVTPEVGAPYDCVLPAPDPDDDRGLEAVTGDLFPEDCTMSYRYWSLVLEGGADQATAVTAELGERLEDESRRLPAALRDAGVTYQVIPTFSDDDARALRQSLAPAVTALRAFALTALGATLVVALLLALRHLRRSHTDLAVARSLGQRTTARAGAVAAGPGIALAVGTAGAVASAVVLSPIGPVGSARTVVPDPDRGLGSSTLLLAAAGVAFLAVGLAVGAWRAAGSVRPEPADDPRRSRATLPGSPVVALGLRAATRGREAFSAGLAAFAAITTVTATLVFAVGVDRLVARPERFGWPFDLALVVNAGYGPTDLDVVTDRLDRPEVAAWGLGLMGDLTIEGETVTVLGGRRGFDPLVAGTSVVSGRVPVGGGEVALGARTARDLEVEVGHEVTVAGPFGEHPAMVTGIVVLPALGPLGSGRTSLGSGALVPEPLLEAVFADAEEVTGQTPEALADRQSGLVVVDLAPGVDADELVADLGDLSVWTPSGFPVVAHGDPVRPAPIIDLDAVRGLPGLLAGVFAVAMAVGLVAAIAAGTRSRHQELAVLRSVGASPSQRRTTIRVHAVATVVLGLGLGLPVGTALGRTVFHRFAEDLGVAPEVSVPILLLVVVTVAALALAVATAEVLGRRAAGQDVWSAQVSRRTAGPKSSFWT